MQHISEIPVEFDEDKVPQFEGTWGLGGAWNAGLLLGKRREVTPREHIWASELGKPLVDNWLALRGTPITNPPNARSLRKFKAGNLFEHYVRVILLTAGILQKSQERVEHQYEGLIKVTGRLDFEAGGVPDYERGRAELEALMLPEDMLEMGQHIIAFMQEKYPNGVEDKVVEVKSCSGRMFDRYVKLQGGKNHRQQLTHYLVGKNKRAGELIYLCRDSLRMLEVPVLNPSPDVDRYKAEVERITKAMQSDEQPAIEPLIIFDSDLGKFSKNWGVEYSNYLTMLYGFERPDLYDAHVKPSIGRFNRVIKRMKDGATMTKNNLEAIAEMRKWGFDPDIIVAEYDDTPDEEEAEG